MYMYKYTGARRKQGKKLKGKENAKAANYPVHQKRDKALGVRWHYGHSGACVALSGSLGCSLCSWGARFGGVPYSGAKQRKKYKG